MSNPVQELAELTYLLNTPELSAFQVRVIIQGQVQLEAQGPGHLDIVKVLLQPRVVYDLFEHAPKDWWHDSTSLRSAITNGWVEIVTPREDRPSASATPKPPPVVPPPSTHIGEFLVYNGSTWVALSPGPAGTVLTSAGPAALPTYQPSSAGTTASAPLITYTLTGQLINEKVLTGVPGQTVVDFSQPAIVSIGLDDNGVTSGVYGSATKIPQITVDAKGRITLLEEVSSAGLNRNIRRVFSDVSTQLDDFTLLVDATEGPVTVTLQGESSSLFYVKKVDSTANTVKLLPASGTLDGEAFFVLRSQWEAASVQTEGGNWFIMSEARVPTDVSEVGGQMTAGLVAGQVCYSSAPNTWSAAQTDGLLMQATSLGVYTGSVGRIALPGSTVEVLCTTDGGEPQVNARLYLAPSTEDGGTAVGKVTATPPEPAPGQSIQIHTIAVCIDASKYFTEKTVKAVFQPGYPIILEG